MSAKPEPLTVAKSEREISERRSAREGGREISERERTIRATPEPPRVAQREGEIRERERKR